MEGKEIDLNLFEIDEQFGDHRNDEIKVRLNKIIENAADYTVCITDSIVHLLESDDPEIVSLSAQAVAELSKSKDKRVVFARQNVVDGLLSVLNRDLADNSLEGRKQTCRALGNLCCDCTEGRNLICSARGLPLIVELIPYLLDEQTNKQQDLSATLLFACKCLLNFLLGGLEYAKCAMETNILAHLTRVLSEEMVKEDMNDDVVENSVLILNVINENMPDYVFDKELNLLVLSILKDTKSIEVSEICLDHLHIQAESDDVKTYLAEAGAVQLLHSRLELLHSTSNINSQDEDVRALCKLACDLIIIILTGDDSMKLLYDNGEGEVYRSMVSWLSSDEKDLLPTAILALGNFARSDEYCIQMMQEGVFDKLLDILSVTEWNTQEEQTVRVQHAALAAVRNLAVARANKVAARDGRAVGLLLRALPATRHHHVAYKLLAALRMLLDGNVEVAVHVGGNVEATRAAAAWGAGEHAGAAGEAPRMLAWTVRQLSPLTHSHILVQMVPAVACLVHMLISSHSVMQNEAIIALTVLSLACLRRLSLHSFHQPTTPDPSHASGTSPSEEAPSAHNSPSGASASETTTPDESCECKVKTSKEEETEEFFIGELIKAELGKHLSILIDTNCGKMPTQVAENLLKFLTVIIEKDRLVEELQSANIDEYLKTIADSRQDLTDDIKDMMEKLISSLSINQI